MEITRYERHGVLFDSCAAMEKAGFPNGFSTRVGGVSPAVGFAEPWGLLRRPAGAGGGEFPPLLRRCGDGRGRSGEKSSGPRDLVRLVTRADVLPPRARSGIVEADGPITRTPGLCLTVFSADCIPGAAVTPGRRWPRQSTPDGGAPPWASRCPGCGGQRSGTRLPPGRPDGGHRAGHLLCCFETHGDVPAGLRPVWGRREAFIHPVPGTDQYHVDLKGATAGGCSRPACLPTVSRSVRLHRLRQRRFLVPPPAGLPPGQPGLCDPDPLRCP